jgi:Flp pilus assembly protein TadD
MLRAAIDQSPRDAGLHHALGLALTRLKRSDEAIDELRRAAEFEPERARYAYVYAVGLHSTGRSGDAMAVLEDTLVRHPNDRDTLLALIGFNRDAGDVATALHYGERLAQIAPDDPDVTALMKNLRRQIEKSDVR